MPEDDLTLQLIAERLRSLRELFDTRFDAMDQQIKVVRDLPRRVERLESRFEDGFRRLKDLEGVQDRGEEYRRGQLPIIIFTILLVFVGVGQVLAAVLHG